MNTSNISAKWSAWAPRLKSVLRIVAAFLFVQVGTAKLFAFPVAVMPGGGTVAVASLLGIAGVLEAFGGLLLLVGLFTRPIAFLLSGEMAVAYFIGHASQGFWPVLTRFSGSTSRLPVRGHGVWMQSGRINLRVRGLRNSARLPKFSPYMRNNRGNHPILFKV